MLVSRLHYFRGTIPHDLAEEVKDFCRAFYPGNGSEIKGRYRYENGWQLLPHNVCVHWDTSVEAIELHAGRAVLEIGGSALDYLKEADLADMLVNHARSVRFRATRIDCALDDYQRRFEPHHAAQAFQQGFCVPFTFHDPRRPQRRVAGENRDTGNGVVFGKLENGREVGFYDKLHETRHRDVTEEDCVRIESRFGKDGGAHKVFRMLAETEDFGKTLGDIVASSIDFRQFPDDEARKHGNSDRYPRVSGWAEIVDRMDKVSFRGSTRALTIDRVRKYLVRNAGPAFACFAVAHGREAAHELLDTILDSRIDNLSPKHLAAVAEMEKTSLREVSDWFDGMVDPLEVPDAKTA